MTAQSPTTRWPLRPEVVAAIGIALLMGCGGGVDKAALDREAAIIHDEMRAGSYRRIHNNADKVMHDAVDVTAFVKTMETVADKLGRPLSSTLQRSAQTLSFPLGRTVTAEYLTKFEKSEGTVTITWRSSGGRLILVGYFVHSPLLKD